jgi:polyisoprenyl-teichoic acid--peptidoglycan teichoic acid transferase
VRKPRRRDPLWARLLVIFGALLMLGSGTGVVGSKVLFAAATKDVTRQDLIGSANTERKHATITGAKNILLVGVDIRASQDPKVGTRSDSIIIMHIPASHDRAYLISVPRDSYVHIPAYDNGKLSYSGGQDKINSAFFFGSRGLTGPSKLSHGFELLSLTVKKLTGITPDAGAIIDFQGFKQVVNVLGKVCMYVDEDTTSIHIGHTKDGKKAVPYKTHSDGTVAYKIPGVTPNFYKKGNHCFTPEEALDFVRQRDLLANHDTDYGRQRHQQQFLKAVLKDVVNKGLSSPTKLPGLLSAVGKTMTVDDGGISLEDWAFAMRGINPNDMITLKTNDGNFNSRSIPGIGSVEILNDTTMELLRAAKSDTVDTFVQAHLDWVSVS